MSRDRNDPFEYDVVLSFAKEDRAKAEELASLLKARTITVLFDETPTVQLGGSDFVIHIAELYRTKAYYCMMLISGHYPLKAWTEAERRAAQEHSLRDANEYILPVRLDDTDVPGLTEASGFRDLRQTSMQSIVDGIEQKLAEAKDRFRPPSMSHDLRSGNLSSTHPPDKRDEKT
jgi:hypothetical protein